MKTARVSCVLLLVALLAAEGGRSKCIFRIHAEANPQDTEVFSTAVKAKLSGKDVAIEKIPRISENDVVSFLPYPVSQGNYGALFQLDEHGRLALDTLSIERNGGLLFVLINGRAITELRIDKRVSDGQIYIPSGLTEADIKLMKKSWHLTKELQH